MKKFWKSLALALTGAFILSACEDVPAPFITPGQGGGDATGTPLATLAATDFMQGQGSWTTQDVSGMTGIWKQNAQYGMVASGFKSSKANAAESWLISPEIDLTSSENTSAVISEAINKIEGGNVEEQAKIYVRTVGSREWTLATANKRPAGTSWTFQDDVIDLSAYDGEKIQMGFQYISTDTSAPSWEIKSVTIKGNGEATIEGSGSGDQGQPDLTDAITCEKAAELVNALEQDETSAETYAIVGYITEVVGSVSRNQQTFWMADTKDGGKVFEAFYANLPEGVTEFKAGTKVVITGKLLKYIDKNSNVVPEIKNPTVIILEDGDVPPTPSVDGESITCAQAVQLTNALEDGATSIEAYTITGYITEVVGNVSRNQQTFWMADTKDGGKVFEAFYANLPEGVTEFKAGSKVKITGNLMKFIDKNGNVVPEIKNPTVIILEEGSDEEDNPVVTPDGVLTVAQAIEAQGTNGATVQGYIVAALKAGVSNSSGNIADLEFSNFTGYNAIFIADNAAEKDPAKMLCVKLNDTESPKDLKSTVNLKDNPVNLGKTLQVTGNLKACYTGLKGIRGITEFKLDGEGTTPTPEPEVTPGEVKHISIAEFLRNADTNTTYELTGTVQNIQNDIYGNFDLVEGDAKIYIYGLLDLTGAAKQFKSLGIDDGDVITLTGKYFLYNGTPEINSAQFIRKE